MLVCRSSIRSLPASSTACKIKEETDMKIKNISIKPIAFGDYTLLPNVEAVVDDDFAPTVETYVSLGYVSVVKEKAAKAAKAAKTKDDKAQPAEPVEG